jgi:hypothetical protein
VAASRENSVLLGLQVHQHVIGSRQLSLRQGSWITRTENWFGSCWQDNPVCVSVCIPRDSEGFRGHLAEAINVIYGRMILLFRCVKCYVRVNLLNWIIFTGEMQSSIRNSVPRAYPESADLMKTLILSYALVRRGADKSLAFLFPAQPKEFFLDGLKKLEQRSHKCVELRGEYVSIFFNPVTCCFLYKAQDFSPPPTRFLRELSSSKQEQKPANEQGHCNPMR